MSDRERWTVYPLILLSLAITLRDRVVPPTVLSVPEIQCQRIEVTGPDLVPQIALGTGSHGRGLIEIVGDDQTPRVLLGALRDDTGVIELSGPQGVRTLRMATDPEGGHGVITAMAGAEHPLVVISAVQGHGAVATLGPEQQKLVELAADGQGGTLVTYGAENSRRVVLDGQHQAGRITLYDKQGRPVYIIMSNEQGTGLALTTDEQGRVHLVPTVVLGQQRVPTDGQQVVPDAELPDTEQPDETAPDGADTDQAEDDPTNSDAGQPE